MLHQKWLLPMYLVAVLEDVSEKEKALEALQASEEEFRLAFENAKDAIFWADPQSGLLINCNKAGELLLERKKEEIVDRHHTMLHPPDQLKHYTNMFYDHIGQRRKPEEEAEIVTKSGKVVPVVIRSSLSVIRGRPIIQGIFRDVTEAKKSESKIIESQKKFKALFELAYDAVYLETLQGKIVDLV